MGAVPAHLQHPVRVAGHLGAAARAGGPARPGQRGARARSCSATLLGVDGRRIRTPSGRGRAIRDADDAEFERRAWAGTGRDHPRRPRDRQARPRLVGGRVTLDVAARAGDLPGRGVGRPVDGRRPLDDDRRRPPAQRAVRRRPSAASAAGSWRRSSPRARRCSTRSRPRPACGRWPRRPAWPSPTSTSCRDRRRPGRRAVHGVGLRRRRDRAPPGAAPRGRARHRRARRPPARRVARPPARRRPAGRAGRPCGDCRRTGRPPRRRWRRWRAVDELPAAPPGARARTALARAPPPGTARPRESIVHSDVRNGNLIVGAGRAARRARLGGRAGVRRPDAGPRLAGAADVAVPRGRGARSAASPAGRRTSPATSRPAGRFDDERFRWWKVEGTLRWAVGLAGQTMAYLDGRVPSIVMAASGRRVSELEWDLLMLIRP